DKPRGRRLVYDRRTHLLIFQSRLRQWHDFQQTLDDVFGFDAFGFGMEVRENSMPENRIRQRLNVFDGNVVTAMNESSRFRAEDQELRRAEMGPVIDILLHEIRRVCAAGPVRARELHRITRDFLGYGLLPDEPLKFENFRPADRLFKLNLTKRGRLVHD